RDMFALLVQHASIDVNAPELSSGDTALHISCRLGYMEFVKLLLERADLDLNRTNNLGENALFIACTQGFIEIVEVLLEKMDQHQINAYTKAGITALAAVSYMGIGAIMKILLKQDGIDVN
ncbi:ankyrin, partial [Ascobolus immersus RN42]